MPTSETARAQRFAAYVDHLATVLGHRDRHEPLRAYVTGLCLPGERKSIEPMAARVDPRHVRARHHCGVLGKQDNCQVAASVSVANEAVSLPVAYQLYLPESWAQARRRRRAVGVPEAVSFQPKWQIALGQIQTLQGEGLPQAPVVADAGYGDTTAFRDALTSAGLPYVVGVKGETTAWPPGAGPRPPKRWKGRGRPPTRVRRTARHTPRSIARLAVTIPAAAWR